MSSYISNDVVDLELTSPEGVGNCTNSAIEATLVNVKDDPVVGGGAELSLDEIAQLKKCESLIAKGLRASMDMGRALLMVRDKKLYRGSHPTFESYVRERWELSRPRAYQLINASVVFHDLSTMVDKSTVLPENERQLRLLARLPDPRARANMWERVVAASEREGVAVSYDLVRRVLDESSLNSAVAYQAADEGPQKRVRTGPGHEKRLEKTRRLENSRQPVMDYERLARLVEGIEEGLIDRDIAKVRVIVRQMKAILNRGK